MSSEVEAALQEIGLSKTQAKVYSALLGLREATGVEIATASGTYKANCYGALDKLVEKGLVVCRLGGRTRLFNCAPPSRLKDLLEEKERKLAAVLPAIERQVEERGAEREVSMLPGFAGWKTYLDEFVLAKERNYVVAFYEAFTVEDPVHAAYAAKKLRYAPPRLRRMWRSIWPDTETTRKRLKARLAQTKDEGERRFVKLKSFQNVAWTVLDDVLWVLFIPPKHKERLLVRMRSKELCDSFEQMFEKLWEKARP